MPDDRSADTGRDELATVIGLYALGDLTLGQAADRLDISRFGMRDILNEAGVQVRLGASSKEALEDEIDTALGIGRGGEDES